MYAAYSVHSLKCKGGVIMGAVVLEQTLPDVNWATAFGSLDFSVLNAVDCQKNRK